MKGSRSGIAALAVITAGCLWGSMGLWVRRFSAAGLDSIQILLLRVGAAVILLGTFLFLYNRKLLKIRWKDIWCFGGTGILSLVFFGYCYNQTIMLTSLSAAAILLYTAPIFVVLMSRLLFGEAMNRRRLLALAMAFAGCVCVTGILSGEQSVSTVGILTGLGSGFGYALYSIFSRFALERSYHPFTVTFYTFVFAFITTLFLADLEPLKVFLFEQQGNMLYSIAYAMTVAVLPYILYTLGLSYVENSRASIMATIEPVVATLLGVFVMGERMTAMNLVGVALVLGAILVLK